MSAISLRHSTSLFGHDHFTAGNDHFTAGFLCDTGIMKLEIGISGEPVAPFWFTGNINIEKADMCAPCAVLAVRGWFECYAQSSS